MQNEEFLSVKSVKSAVQYLWLRLAMEGLLRLFAANQRKRLSMNNLHTKSGISDQGQSRLIKVNQDIISVYFTFFPVMLEVREHGQAAFN
jgi:hypothetical protein